MTDTVWKKIVDQRLALIDDLAMLDDDALRSPSLCEGWSIEDVVAHLVQRNLSSRLGLVTGTIRHGFSLSSFIDAGVAEHRGQTPRETLLRFQETDDFIHRGPFSRDTYLGELLVHAEDIRRPLGITHHYPEGEVRALLRSRARLARRTLQGLSLVVNGCEMRIGQGAEVRGPAMSLLMVTSGRRAHLEDLEGPGAPLLAERLRR